MAPMRPHIRRPRQPVGCDLALDGQIPVIHQRRLVNSRRLVGDGQHRTREYRTFRRREWGWERTGGAAQGIAEWTWRWCKRELRAVGRHVGNAVIEDAGLPRIVKHSPAAANAGAAITRHVVRESDSRFESGV